MFPGDQLGIAWTLGTGWGQPALQMRIDDLEHRIITGEELREGDRPFLSALYRAMATGGRLTGIAPQTGRMMNHYLGREGTDYILEPDIFTQNKRVAEQMTKLRGAVVATGCTTPSVQKSGPFYMPHRSQPDSHFGLYYGTLEVAAQPTTTGDCAITWRAEVPWTWPSYEQLTAKHGSPRHERFPLPNLKSALFGHQHMLRIGNGLGAHLARVGLAEPFLARSEWQESVAL